MDAFSDNSIAQFENVNSLRKYPFSDDSSIVDRYGREVSQDIVVDVHMVVPAEFENPQSGMSEISLPEVRLSSVHMSPYMISACFTSSCGTESSALSVTVSSDGFVPYRTYMLEKLHGSMDIGGIVTFGEVQFPGFPETYFFDNAKIHPCCISATRPAMLRRFIDGRSGESARGDVKIDFSAHVKSSPDGKKFRLYLDDRSLSLLASECASYTGAEACGATPIRTINGIRPDEDGNIVLWFH